jgi:hypothetical protein
MSRMISVLTVVLLLSAGHSLAIEWNFHTAQPVSVGWWTSLEIDSSGYPHMSYRMENGQDLSYVYWDGSTWQTTLVDTEEDVGLWSSLKLDSSEYPHISYMYKEGNDYDLKYAHANSSGWQIETVDPVGSVGWCTSLDLDSSEYPHISYRDNGNFDLKYARWDGSGWQIETVDNAGMVGLWSSMVIDSFDHPHISYMDYGNGALKYARWDGSTWQIETVDYDSDPTIIIGFNTSLALDSDGFAHISYVWYQEIQEPPDPIDANSLKYARWDGSSWQIEFVDEGQGDNDLVGWWNSIALDSLDYPHISFGRNSPENQDLRYARWDGSAWQIECVSAGIQLKGTSLKLDGSDNPRIACVRNQSALHFIWSGTGFHLLSPACGEMVTTTEPVLDWEDCNLPCFTSYTLWWGTDPYFGDYNEVTGIIDSEYQITEGVEEGDTIYWRVKSIYGSNEYWADEIDWYFDVDSSAGIDISVADALPELMLYSVSPNPSREMISFGFWLPEEGHVNLMVYDLSGRCVASSARSNMTAGRHEVSLCCAAIPPGVYFCRLESGSGCFTRRLVIIH